MSDSQVSGVNSSTASSSEAGQVSSSGATSSTAAKNYNASTQIASLADLKEKAPDLYKAMLEGVGMKIVNEMKDHQQRIKELNAEGRRQAEGR